MVWPFLIHTSPFTLIPFFGTICLGHPAVFTYYCLSSLSFFFQVEVSPPVTGRVLEEETVIALSVAFFGMEEEPPSGGMAEETEQPMQGVQTTQDPEAS